MPKPLIKAPLYVWIGKVDHMPPKFEQTLKFVTLFYLINAHVPHSATLLTCIKR